MGTSSRARPRARFLEFCRYLRSLYPPQVRIAIICDNFHPASDPGTSRPSQGAAARAVSMPGRGLPRPVT
jgi:hypothetical protein